MDHADGSAIEEPLTLFSRASCVRPQATRKRKIESEEDEESTGARTRPSCLRVQRSPAPAQQWTVRDSERLYNVKGWGAPYFSINDAGHVDVDPTGLDPDVHIDLFELVEDVMERGHSLPLLIRFSDVLRDRIKLINEAFRTAISENSYQGEYKGVFPIKVCQQRRVIKEVIKYGKSYRYGLEAGSKPELLIALAHSKTQGLITCNGYKDSEYVETALLAQQLGQTVIVVIEKLHELPLLIQAAKKLNIPPMVGVRAKLSTRGVGRWCHSSGDHAKFGLSAGDIVEVVRMLREEQMLASLQLLHFHIGSQVSRIAVVKDALREAGQFFVQLHAMGAQMRYLDVGGGLGVDYDGSKTSFAASMNYSVLEYAADVVSAIKTVCDKNGVPHPCIVSESGRAVCSHQSVLVFSVLGATTPITNAAAPCHPLHHDQPPPTDKKGSRSGSPELHASASSAGLSAVSAVSTVSADLPDKTANPTNPTSDDHNDPPDNATEAQTDTQTDPPSGHMRKEHEICVMAKPRAKEHPLVHSLHEVWTAIHDHGQAADVHQLQELYHDAVQYKSEALTLFPLGLVSLAERARIEQLFWYCCRALLPLCQRLKYVPQELQELEKMMSFIYYCNISVFQSAPDTWAIHQLFPIMPIHRLDERPTALATLADITCDSDGKIDKFISSTGNDFKDLLELHELDDAHPYYLGMFLCGAYQEVLGNLHNLFGDTNVIHIQIDPKDKKGYSVEHVVKGDTTEEVLQFMQYTPKMMLENVRLQSEQALNRKKLTLPQYRLLVKHYEKALSKYTYLWADED